MAVLARANFTSQQRLDLSDILSIESFTAFDFRAMISSFVGESPYIVRGFEVVGKTGLSVNIAVDDVFVFNPKDSVSSFYIGSADDSDLILDLEPNQSNIYVEVVFKAVSQVPRTYGFWDPLATSSGSEEGSQFSATQNSQVVVQLEILSNTVGFTSDSIPLFIIQTGAGEVTNITDARPLFFRLGTGGASPNPFSAFPWSTNRNEPPYSGPGVGDQTDSTFWAFDNNGVRNDKGIRSFKDAFDAIYTRISEISGSPLWYTNGLLQQFITGLNINTVYLDSEAGHSVEPNKNAAFVWEKNDVGTKAVSEVEWITGTTTRYYLADTSNLFVGNTISIAGFLNASNNGSYVITSISANTYVEVSNPNRTSAADDETSLVASMGGKYYYFGLHGTEPVTWRANFGKLEWQLGETFTSASDRTFLNTNFFKNIPDGSNVYLRLDRENPVGSGDPVQWKNNSAEALFDVTKSISGLPGDFVGIAIGDYVRKESEGISQYYRVVRMSGGGIFTADNYVAGAGIVALELDSPIVSSSSTERIVYFRSKYSADDIFVDPYNNPVYNDVNYYWLGRRNGEFFMLRQYGIMQPGEEVEIIEDSSSSGGFGGAGGANDFILEHGYSASYNAQTLPGQYGKTDFVVGGTEPLLTIRKRKSDNTEAFPGPTDNSQSLLTYTIPSSTIMSLAPGQSLWVRLSDTVGGVLSSGSVTDANDDLDNTLTIFNTYEVRNSSDLPLKTFDNRHVFLVARCVTLANGKDSLVFVDGSTLGTYGQYFNNSVFVEGQLRVYNDQNTYIRMTNNTGGPIAAGSVVALSQTVAGEVFPAIANDIGNCEGVIGVALEAIADGDTGFVQTEGIADVLVDGTLQVGKFAYLSPLVLGRVSKDTPTVTGHVRYMVGIATAAGKIRIRPDFQFIVENVYEEEKLVVSGTAANTNEVQGPLPANTGISLPFDSRDGNTTQSYQVGSGTLQVFLNGVKQILGNDYEEVGTVGDLSTEVEMLIELLVGDILEFRIDLEQGYISSASGGGGGGSSLQDAYTAGRFITTTPGAPVEISGSGGKLLRINGDMDVTGVIDPKGITFTAESVDPLGSGDRGLWVNTTGDLIYKDGPNTSTINISAQIGSGQVIAIADNFSKQAVALSAFQPVSTDTGGLVGPVNVSVEQSAFATFGITTAAALIGDAVVKVLTSGRLTDTGLAIPFGLPIYVSKTGGLTTTKPSVGIGGFLAGDYVILLGRTVPNLDNPANVDIVINLQIIGQL